MRTLHSLLALTSSEAWELLAPGGAPAVPGSGARVDRPLDGRVVSVLLAGPVGLPAAAWLAGAGRLGATVLREADFEGIVDDPVAIALEAARWSDLVVASHPLRGFARALAAASGCAVLNAGETGGEDPTAGISLLAAINTTTGRSEDALDPIAAPLRVAVCGDLRGSRSARALLGGLAALDANVLLVPAKARDLPRDQVQRIARCMRRRPQRFHARSMRTLLDMVDTVLLAREEQAQLPLFRELGVPLAEAERRARREIEDLDALFVAAKRGGADRLVSEPFRHRRTTLPEGAEHSAGRSAVEAVLRFCAGESTHVESPIESVGVVLRYRSAAGLRCRSQGCVAARLPDLAGVDFAVLGRDPYDLECLYCGERTRAEFAGSIHEGRVHPVDSPHVRRVLDPNLVLFRTRGEALSVGFE